MRRELQRDKARMVVDRAVGEVRRGRQEMAGGALGGFSSTGSQSIQDPDGNLLFMCGVSKCGGADVCGP